jgi:hypothetical protein
VHFVFIALNEYVIVVVVLVMENVEECMGYSVYCDAFGKISTAADQYALLPSDREI